MSKLIVCPTCGGKFSSSASKCPHCGEPHAPQRGVMHYLAIILGLIFFTLGLVAFLAGSNAMCLVPLGVGIIFFIAAFSSHK